MFERITKFAFVPTRSISTYLEFVTELPLFIFISYVGAIVGVGLGVGVGAGVGFGILPTIGPLPTLDGVGEGLGDAVVAAELDNEEVSTPSPFLALTSKVYVVPGLRLDDIQVTASAIHPEFVLFVVLDE